MEELSDTFMEKLIEARSEYDRFLGTDRTDQESHAEIVGKAIAVCLAANNQELTRIASHELTPYFSDKKRKDGTKELDWASRNRNAMHDAVQQLAKIIKDS